MKRGDALSSIVLSFDLECAIKSAHKTYLVLNLNFTHHLFVYADDVYLKGDDIRTIERNVDGLFSV